MYFHGFSVSFLPVIRDWISVLCLHKSIDWDKIFIYMKSGKKATQDQAQCHYWYINTPLNVRETSTWENASLVTGKWGSDRHAGYLEQQEKQNNFFLANYFFYGSSLKKIQLTVAVPLSLSTSNLHENTFLGQCWESYCYPIKEKYIPDWIFIPST